VTTIVSGPSGIPYRLDVTIRGPRAKKDASLTAMLKIIDTELRIGKGKTTLSNVFLKQALFVYTDMADQPKDFQKMLKTLIGYKMLKPAEKFSPNAPVTYGLLLEKYLSWVHNIDITTARTE
jgi:hypothetical protein